MAAQVPAPELPMPASGRVAGLMLGYPRLLRVLTLYLLVLALTLGRKHRTLWQPAFCFLLLSQLLAGGGRRPRSGSSQSSDAADHRVNSENCRAATGMAVPGTTGVGRGVCPSRWAPQAAGWLIHCITALCCGSGGDPVLGNQD